MKKQSIQEQPDRILARRLAREIPKDQLRQIAGGNCSCKWSSSTPLGEGDDGGRDD